MSDETPSISEWAQESADLAALTFPAAVEALDIDSPVPSVPTDAADALHVIPVNDLTCAQTDRWAGWSSITHSTDERQAK